MPNACLPCKEIINNGFVGPLAQLLAATVGEGSLIYVPAIALARTARAAVEVFGHGRDMGLFVMPAGREFEGCAEATEVAQMIAMYLENPRDAARLDVVVPRLEKLRADIVRQMTEFVSGRM